MCEPRYPAAATVLRMHSDHPTEDRPIGTPGWWAEPSLPPG